MPRILALLLLPSLAVAAPPPPCGLPADLPDRLVALRPGGGARDADYTLRDTNPNIPHVVTSKHFALKWGSQAAVPEWQQDALLQRFEYAWEESVQAWGLADPTGIDGTFFNVYIGDTGPEVPSAFGAGGYYTVDEEGYPIIVMATSVLDEEEWADTVVSHEFFHAVQGATGAYQEWDAGGWYWEATAEWASGQLYPDGWSWAGWLAAFAYSPHFSVSTHANDGGVEPPNLHQYGAFIFPQYLSEVVGEPTAVVRSWAEGGPNSDPLDLLAAALPDHDLGALYADHAAHNVVWDYPRGVLYEAIVDSGVDWLGGWDERVMDTTEDDQGWLSVGWSLRPQRFAYNVIEVPDSARQGDSFTLSFDGDPTAWQLRLVHEAAQVTYQVVEPSPDGVEVSLPTVGDAWLVVTAVPPVWSGGQRYAWQARFDGEEPPPPTDDDDATEPPDDDDTTEPQVDDDDATEPPEDDDDPRDARFGLVPLGGGGTGCSCQAGGSAGLSLLPLLLLGLRRR